MSGTPGHSGRRKPVALKIYEGSPRVGAAPAEPQFRPGIPECPTWMPLPAQDYWREIVPELAYVPGLLQRVDRAVLEQTCMAYYRWRMHEAFLVGNGATYRVAVPYAEGGDDETKFMWKARPEAKLAKEASQELARLRSELGLSPKARTTVGLPKPTDGPAAAGLLDTDAV